MADIDMHQVFQTVLFALLVLSNVALWLRLTFQRHIFMRLARVVFLLARNGNQKPVTAG